MILDRILDTKRREVAERRAATPLATVQAQARAQTPARDFIAETLAADLGAVCVVVGGDFKFVRLLRFLCIAFIDVVRFPAGGVGGGLPAQQPQQPQGGAPFAPQAADDDDLYS